MLLNSTTCDKYCMHARIANMAHHFPDAKLFLDRLIDFRESIAEDFTMNERYLISLCYKNYIGDVQVSARVATLLSKN